MPGNSSEKLRCRARRTLVPQKLLHRSQLRHKMQEIPASARVAPTGSPDGNNVRRSARLLCYRPLWQHSGADCWRQKGCIRRHSCGAIWCGAGRGQGKKCSQRSSKRSYDCGKKQRSHSGNRGRFSFAPASLMSGFSSCSIIFSGTTQVGGRPSTPPRTEIFAARRRTIKSSKRNWRKKSSAPRKNIRGMMSTSTILTRLSMTRGS